MYVELQVPTHFSFLRGVSSAEELFAAAALLGYPALGIADRNSVGGLVKALRAADATGVRLVAGCRLDLMDGAGLAGLAGGPRRLVAPHPPAHRSARAAPTARKARRGNASSTGRMSPPGARAWSPLWSPDEADRGRRDRARPARRHFRGPRPSRPHPPPPPRRRGAARTRSTRLARRLGVRRLATGDVLYDSPDKRMLQDVVTAIRHKCTIDDLGFRRERFADRHLKSPEEMERRFAAYPDAVRATAEIAERCTFSLRELSYQYPDEIVMTGRTPQEALERLTRERARRQLPGRRRRRAYVDLLEHELRLVEQAALRALFPDRQFGRRSSPAARRSSARAAARRPIR